MKKVLSVLVAVLLIVVACVPAFAAAPTSMSIALDATSKTAAVGDQITVYFYASDVSGCQAKLAYNTSEFQLVSTENGTMGLTVVDSETAGAVKAAIVNAEVVPSGLVFKATFKVLKTGGVFTATATDAVGEGITSIPVTNSGITMTIAAKTPGVTAAPAGTTSAPVAPTTAAPAGTTKAPATTSKNSVKIPQTGGTVSVVACGASVLVLAAAVAYTMKKKSDEE